MGLNAPELRSTRVFQEMPQKTNIGDYEPVTPTGSSGAFAEADADRWSGTSWSKPDSGSAWVDRVDAVRTRPTSPSAANDDQNRKKAVLKRGHTVSFAGLFLFSFVLYFRPYELFPGLAWASSSAFWIAMVTLVLYVPTQLALEGKLTVRPREVTLLLLLLLAGLLSIGVAVERLRAWYGFVDFLKVVVMFIVMVNVVRTEKRLRALIFLAMFAGCALSVSAVNDYRLGRFVLGFHERIQGLIGNLFDNPNDLALHLVTMIPIAVALLLSSRGGPKKLFFGVCAVLMFAGVVVTFSRGGFIGIVCAGGVFAWKVAHRNKLLIGVLIPVMLAGFILLAPLAYQRRLSTTLDESGLARREDLKRSLFVAVHHPLFGVGMNNYVVYSNINHASHNAYTEVASETGFPAAIVYILFLITPLRRLGRIASESFAARRTSSSYYLAIGLEASLVGYMAASFFLSVAYLWYAYYLVGYCICFRRIYEAAHVSPANMVENRGRSQPPSPVNRLEPRSAVSA